MVSRYPMPIATGGAVWRDTGSPLSVVHLAGGGVERRGAAVTNDSGRLLAKGEVGRGQLRPLLAVMAMGRVVATTFIRKNLQRIGDVLSGIVGRLDQRVLLVLE